MRRSGLGMRYDTQTCAIVTTLSSSGWRKTSRTWRRHSGYASKKRTPWWASDTSPGIGTCPPPISPASEMVWWGARHGRVVTHAVRSPVTPATRWIRVVSMASARVIAGRMVVRRRASIDLPAPGAPNMNTLSSHYLDTLHLCAFTEERRCLSLQTELLARALQCRNQLAPAVMAESAISWRLCLMERLAQSLRIVPNVRISPVFPSTATSCISCLGFATTGKPTKLPLDQVWTGARGGALGRPPRGRAEPHVAHEQPSPRAVSRAGPPLSGAPPAAPAGYGRPSCRSGGRAVRPVPAARR
jgi:hypothetical protein